MQPKSHNTHETAINPPIYCEKKRPINQHMLAISTEQGHSGVYF